ncbi:KOW domain-containing protein [Mycolicibacterium frederiksbergense]
MINTEAIACTVPVLVAGDRVRVSQGILGRVGRVSSTSPGYIFVHYDDGARELVDPTRRQIWLLR